MKHSESLCQKLFAYIVCIGVVFIFSACIKDYLNLKFSAIYTFTAEIDYQESWDGSEDYPFEDMTINESDNATNTSDTYDTSGALKTVINYAATIKNKFIVVTDSWTQKVTSSNFLYYPSVVADKIFNKICGFNVTTAVSAQNDTLDTSDIVVELGENYLARVVDEDAVTVYGIDNLDSLIAFGEKMESEGRNFLYAAAPDKIELADYSGVVSQIYPDYSSDFADFINESVSAAGLNVVSITESLNTVSDDNLLLFYETDHHWKAQAGLLACGILGESLNELFAYEIDTDMFEIDNYEIITLSDYWLGSLGHKSTFVYSDLEDFELILPNYETDLEVYRSETDSIYYGSIEDTLFNWELLEGTFNTLKYTVYDYYGYGDMSYISIHNNDIDDGSNILLIKVSYADCVYPYLAATVENLDVLDLRYFTGSVESFIEDHDPDTVIVLYQTLAFALENEWDHTSLFDFR